jgi:photosystem II stability/assembly factor-like uncharacterized protein
MRLTPTNNLLIIAFFFFLSPILAQSNWEWQYPIPQSNNLNCIKVFNKDTIVSVGTVGMTLRSVNGGATWTITPKVCQQNLRNVFFLNDNLGWAVGDKGTMIKTIDGGINWISFNPVTINNFDYYAVAFTDSLHGFLSCYETITGYGSYIKTSDGGLTWSAPVIMVNDRIHSIYFYNQSIGWMFCGGPQNWKTIDGGQSWFTQGAMAGVSAVYDCNFKDSLTGYVSCAGGKLFKTNNGGTSWSLLTSGTTVSLYGLRMANDSTIWATGWNPTPSYPSRTLKSTDNGLTWTAMISQTYRDFNDIDVADDSILFAVGNNGKIYKSNDNGITWNNLRIGLTANQMCVDFSDSLHGWVGSELGYIFHTTNGGQTWNSQLLNAGVYITDVFALNSDTVFITSGTNIKRTYNGGTTWITTPMSDNVNAVFFNTTSSGWATGADEMIYHTTNCGATWSIYSYGLNPETFQDIYFTDPLNGWIVGGTGSKVLHTSDGGTTWSVIFTLNTTTNNMFLSVNFYDTLYGIVNGYSTCDGGHTWNAATTGQDPVLTDPIHGLGVGWSPNYNNIGGVYHFTLGLFPVFDLALSEDLFFGEDCNNLVQAIWRDRNGNTWAVGDQGSIFHLVGGCNIAHPVITSNVNTLSTSVGYISYEWYLNGILNYSSASPSFNPGSSGYYVVNVIDSNGCEAASDPVYWSLPTAYLNSDLNYSVKLFPNPTHNNSVLTFSPAAVLIERQIEVYDMYGRCIIRLHSTDPDIVLETKSLSSGIYIIKINELNSDSRIHVIRWVIN